MLKILKLTSLLCILLLGGIDSNLNAQNVSDSTSVDSKKNKGIQVIGLIKNANTGDGISGINIAVEGFSAAISNEDGSFSINVPHLNSLLLVSGQNYQTKIFALNNIKEGIEINLFEDSYSQFYQKANLPSTEQLQYTSTKSAQVLDFEKDQWSNPVNQSVGSFLQGRIAGLNSVGNSGVPGVGSYLTLRGFNSLYATNKPLIVLDGMIYDDEDYGSGIIQYNISSPLSMLDVKDIEDITVLKDGSSLYGTKGANGVIIITTTRPVDLSTKIDFTMYGGINEDSHELPVMNSGEYRTYLSQLIATGGASQEQIAAQPWMLDNRDSGYYYQYHNQTNWQDQVFKSSANQSYFLKIRGGDEIAKYGISVGYLNSEGIAGNSDLQRYNVRLNSSLRLTEKLLVNANLSFVYNNENQNNQGLAYKTSPFYLGLTKSPFTAVNVINETGEVSPNLADVDIFDVGNPNAIIENGIAINKNYRFFGNLKFQYDFSKAIKANLLVGLTYNKERENFFIPDFGVASIQSPIELIAATNRSGSEVQRYYSLYTDGFLTYTKNFNFKSNINVRLGLRTQSNESESDLGLGFNSATDDFTTVGAGSNLLRQVGGALGEWNWYNAYFSGEYSHLNKYFLTLNASYDGSSRFGEDITLTGLGSISGAWLVSSEKFMKNSGIDLFKLRASVGISGNDDIGNYTAQQLYVSQNLLGIQGLVRGNIGNPELKWESVRKINLGTDLSLFNERLNASLDVFENKTTDMITYETLTTPSGFDYIVSNSGTMNTRGFDVGLNSRLINTPDVKFDLGLNVARYKNEVLDIPNDRIITQFGGATYITEEGQDANLFYGYKSIGVYATTAQATSVGLSKRLDNGSLMPFSGGDVIFEDLNGDKIIDDDDRKVIGNPNPDFTGSLSANFTYKKLSLSALFNFSEGNDLYNGVRQSLESMSGYENQSKAINNRWVAEGQQTSIPKATWGDPLGNASFSSRWIENGSYIRLKTLVLSYDIDVDSNSIKYMKVYASGNNLFTLTDYLGYDPEFSATSSIFGQGADIGLMPQFMTIQLGLRLGL